MDAQLPRRFRSSIEMLSGSLPSYVRIKAGWMNREKNWNDVTEGGAERERQIFSRRDEKKEVRRIWPRD